MITEETLKKWRKEALEWKTGERDISPNNNPRLLAERILCLIQELLDQNEIRIQDD